MSSVSLRALAAATLAFACVSVHAQGDGSCILAGRLAEDGHWAPRFEGVELLGADGKALRGGGKEALAGVRQARLSAPALLSRCDGNQPLARADEDLPRAKTPVPALSAGVVDVEAVAYPRLRTGGELVELRVRVPAERVVMLTR
ncbi:hypothetical protein FN976_17730 [Caenimonas sedimenti]|uniref:Uncharacterized protein n=1 Tax=Caenimonas sedimenti TaxID=2596921 RepID=A0A562ZM71_9BURK|nr:hypothetical protein [Caenimonas sedimenti]TWO69672.1 hypothetical protein FN976_17730 [Caenimonas sedimenti]